MVIRYWKQSIPKQISIIRDTKFCLLGLKLNWRWKQHLIGIDSSEYVQHSYFIVIGVSSTISNPVCIAASKWFVILRFVVLIWSICLSPVIKTYFLLPPKWHQTKHILWRRYQIQWTRVRSLYQSHCVKTE